MVFIPYLGCVWIPLILLKTENNKKIIFELLFTQKTMFIWLFVLFMSHEKYNRHICETLQTITIVDGTYVGPMHSRETWPFNA